MGVELESFTYRIDPITRKAVSVSFQAAEDSLAPALIRAANAAGGQVCYVEEGGENPAKTVGAIAFSDGNSFTFEPGGQVEISTAPCDNLDELASNVERMQDILKSVTQDAGISFAQIGAQPWFQSEEIGLQVRKQRYLAMDSYFDSIGPFGRRMMRQTCSLQVNLELGCEPSAFVRRFVGANLLSPFSTAIFANSSVFAGKVQEQKSYRSFLWRRLDPRRTGIVGLGKSSSTFAVGDLVDAYLEFALQAPLIYLDGVASPLISPNFTWERWLREPLQGHEPTTALLANHLSLLFPEVRPRGHVEIRSIDVLPVEWQLVPASFYAGLLLPEKQLEKTLDCLLPLIPRMDVLLEQAPWGLASPELSSLANRLMKLAIDGLVSLPKEFRGRGHLESLVSFYEGFTARGRTLADLTAAGYRESMKHSDEVLTLSHNICV